MNDTMTPEAMNRAIADLMGQKVPCSETVEGHDFGDWQHQSVPFPFRFRRCNSCWTIHIEGEQRPTMPSEDWVAPDYLGDRTAMAAALSTLTDAELIEFLQHFRDPKESALDHLRSLMCGDMVRFATAFLKAKGKYAQPTV